MIIAALPGCPWAGRDRAAPPENAGGRDVGVRRGRPATGTLPYLRRRPASFLLLEADPLADISHLRRLHAVVLRGRFLDADDLARATAQPVTLGLLRGVVVLG